MSLIIQAGGGVIQNEKNQVLLIYRRKKWDLPKGKLDPGETLEECAVREVKEETGLQSVLLIKKLTVTQHTYLQDSIQFIKETHWYLMSATTLENKTLTPQLEEEIEKIEWIDIDLLPPYLEDSYPTIRQVLSLL
jgi:mutator protein MutT